MTKVTLFWNHICVLHNEEKRFLQEAKKNLLKQEIDLQIQFFGLGYANHMSEYIAGKDGVIPDIIVSADLEVFEHKQLYNKLGKLHNTEDWLALKADKIVQDIRRKQTLLPFVAIPLVCYTNDLEHCKNKTLKQIAQGSGFAFGGINNSAGKTIAKIAMEKYDAQFAQRLLENSNISDMPIGAFQSVRTKANKTAIVPTIYALRADGVNTHTTTLKEGVFLIPSYFACANTVSEQVGKAVMGEIINEKVFNMYSNSGNLIICPDYETDKKTEEQIDTYTVLSQKFIDVLDDDEFYDLYTSKIKTAKHLKVEHKHAESATSQAV